MIRVIHAQACPLALLLCVDDDRLIWGTVVSYLALLSGGADDEGAGSTSGSGTSAELAGRHAGGGGDGDGGNDRGDHFLFLLPGVV